MAVYEYLSQNIATVLLIAASFLLILWIAQIFRTLIGITSLTIGVHNDSVRYIKNFRILNSIFNKTTGNNTRRLYTG